MTEMPDRAKIYRGMDVCTRPDFDCMRIRECPYVDEGPGCVTHLLRDVYDMLRRPPAVWQYYTNDEGKARWKCSACGKICRRDPRDKKFCSACGAEMRMEA